MKQPDVKTLLQELYRATGFRISIHGTDYREIMAYPEEPLEFCRCLHESGEALRLCVESDLQRLAEAAKTGKTVLYQCPFGLYEAVSPLYRYGTLAGYLMMGQVLAVRGGEEAVKKALSFCHDPEALSAAIAKLPQYDTDRISTYANIMSVFAGYMTLSNVIRERKSDLPAQVRTYLSKEFHQKITLQMLCGRFLCSRTTLIHAFSSRYGESIRDFLNRTRLEHAHELLSSGDMPIKDVAASCGFSDAGYFSKAYKRYFGVTPGETRKENEKGEDF